MAQRFDEFVNLQFNDPGTGAASGLMNLSRQFQGFRDRAFETHKRQVVEEQTAEGRAAFVKGQAPEFKEEGFIGGVSARAYNAGLKSAYLASLSNDLTEDLATIERENEADSAGYNSAISAHRAALEQEVDPSVLPEVLANFDKFATMGSVRVQDTEFRNQRKAQVKAVNDAVDSAASEAARLARNLDLEGAAAHLVNAKNQLQLGVDAEVYTQDEADAIFAGHQREAIEQENRANFEALVDTRIDEYRASGLSPNDALDRSIKDAYRELDRIAGKPPKGWDAEEWAGYIKSQQAELSAKERRLKQDDKAAKAEISKQNDFADIDARLKGGTEGERIVLNEKRVDEYYQERLMPLLDTLPPEARDTAIANYVDKTKVMPASLKKQVTSYIRSDNPELIAEASKLANRLDEIPGMADNIASTNERAFAETVVDLMANMEAPEAVALARQATDPRDKARIEAVNNEIKEQFKGSLAPKESDWYKEQAADVFSKFWGSDPSVDPLHVDQMGKEWGDSYKAYRRAGLDEDKAGELANGSIKRNWSVFNGKVMKYSPDAYYGTPDGDNEYILEQLAKDISEDSLREVSSEDIILIPDEITARGGKCWTARLRHSC